MSATATITNTSQTDIELTQLPESRETGVRSESQDHLAAGNTGSPKRDWKLLFQLMSCGVSFFVAGVNDGSLGALLPYVIRSYGLTTAIASSV